MFKLALVGAGPIAIKMSNTVKHMEGIELYAVAGLNLEEAENFAKTYGVTKAFASYEEMLADSEIDLAYIAVPHTLHHKFAKMCLEAGKHVLCEKPFCVNTEQALDLQKTAKEKKLLITEAIWTRYMPSRKIVDDIIASGKIGEVTSLTANLGYDLREVKRIWNPAQAGGALLDVGVYLIHFVRMIFGEREAEITSKAVFKDGVDMIDSITMTFDDGKMATLQSNVYAVQNRNASIFGTEGYIEITNINNPEVIRVFDAEYNEVECIVVPEQISGYEYEVEACMEAIKNGDLECPQISHEETIKVMQIMDDIRKSWGYEIPGEK